MTKSKRCSVPLHSTFIATGQSPFARGMTRVTWSPSLSVVRIFRGFRAFAFFGARFAVFFAMSASFTAWAAGAGRLACSARESRAGDGGG
jgi:hypothetical protein